MKKILFSSKQTQTMRNGLLLIFFICLSLPFFAQSIPPTVTVLVNEPVELKLEQAIYSVNVESHQDQLRRYMENEEYNEYETFEGDFYELVEQGGMSEKEFRQKEREFYQEQERKHEAKKASFSSFTENDLISLLKKNKLSYTTQTSISQHRYDYENSEVMDTTIFITLVNQAEYERMRSLLIDKPVYFLLTTANFEPIENHLEVTIPLLTTKAKTEATIVARSLDKKIGNIVECTKDTQNYPNRETYYRVDQYDRDRFINPFEKTHAASIQYSYTFELLN